MVKGSVRRAPVLSDVLGIPDGRNRIKFSLTRPDASTVDTEKRDLMVMIVVDVGRF